MPQPLTVVTIARDDLAGLQHTFASLAAQTCVDVQHVVVDGASTDGGPEWAREHAVFPDTTVVSEPDRGIYDAMNKGLARAEGELVCFLNAGDAFASPTVVEEALASFRERGWDWAFGMGQMVDELGQRVRSPQRSRYSWWRETFWHFGLYHQAVFMRTAFARSLGGFDERFRIAADYHLMTKAGRASAPCVIPSLFALNLHGGISHTNPERTHREAHVARVDVLGLGPVRAALDLGWAYALMGKARLRQQARRAIVRVSGPGPAAVGSSHGG